MDVAGMRVVHMTRKRAVQKVGQCHVAVMARARAGRRVDVREAVMTGEKGMGWTAGASAVWVAGERVVKMVWDPDVHPTGTRTLHVMGGKGVWVASKRTVWITTEVKE